MTEVIRVGVRGLERTTRRHPGLPGPWQAVSYRPRLLHFLEQRVHQVLHAHAIGIGLLDASDVMGAGGEDAVARQLPGQAQPHPRIDLVDLYPGLPRRDPVQGQFAAALEVERLTALNVGVVPPERTDGLMDTQMHATRPLARVHGVGGSGHFEPAQSDTPASSKCLQAPEERALDPLDRKRHLGSHHERRRLGPMRWLAAATR